MNKYYAEFNSDPLFFNGEANKKTVKAQIANNNALLQQQKKGGNGTVGNMSKLNNKKQYEIASKPVSNQNKQSTTLGNGNSGGYSYDPKTGQTIRQPSVLTQSNNQDIMKADSKALRQALFKESEDVLGRLFLDGLEGRETPKYLLQNIPQQEKKQNELSAEQEYAFWEGFNYNDEDALRELEREKSRYEKEKLGNNLALAGDFFGVVSDVSGGVIGNSMAIDRAYQSSIDRSREIDTKIDYSKNTVSKTKILKNTEQVAGSLIKNSLGIVSYGADLTHLGMIGHQQGMHSEDFQAKSAEIALNGAIDIATRAVSGLAVAAVGTAAAPYVIAAAVVVTLAGLLASTQTEDWGRAIADGSFERMIVANMPQDAKYYETLAKEIEQKGYERVVQEQVLGRNMQLTYLF